MDTRAIAIVVGVDKNSGEKFGAILYNNGNDFEEAIYNNAAFERWVAAKRSQGYVCEIITKEMTLDEWKLNKTSLIEEAKELCAQIQKKQVALEAKRSEVEKAVENDTGVKNFRLSKKMLAIIMATVIGVTGLGVALNHILKKDGSTNTPTPSLNGPSISRELPDYLAEQQELALKEKYALGELSYDLTDKEEVMKRIGYLEAYANKMTKHHLTSSEIADFYLVSNGIEPIFNDDVDDIMRKVQLAASDDAGFDWRENTGEEIIASKKDSAYLDIYLKAINDWKVAAESKNPSITGPAGKEFAATGIYGIVLKEPLDTGIKEIGSVHMHDVSLEMQTFITGYVGMAINYPGLDIMDTFGKITIQGEEVDINYLSEPIAGPHVIPTGEQGRTDQGGEQGLAHATMIRLVNKYQNGDAITCPSELKQLLEQYGKEAVKQIGGQ